jgi:hypothetical protein
MPRHASGNPPWKAVAVKLPPELLDAVQRYSDLHRINVSQLIREGLEWRLYGQAHGQVADQSPFPETERVHLAATLHQLAERLWPGKPSTGPTGTDTTGYNGNTLTDAKEYDGYTATDAAEYNGNTPPVSDSAPQPSAETLAEEAGVIMDPELGPILLKRDKSRGVKFYLGGAGKKCGHRYRDTGQTLYLNRTGYCRECDREGKRRKRQEARGDQ